MNWKPAGMWFDGIVRKAASIFAPDRVSVDDLAQEAYVSLLKGMRRACELEHPTLGDYKLAKTIVCRRLARVVRRKRPQPIDPDICDDMSPDDRVPALPPYLLPPGGTPDGQVVRAVLELGGCCSQKEAALRLGLTEVEMTRALGGVKT